jgi:fatty-acyl-CoA synthase
MDLWAILERAAHLHPRNTAVIDGARRTTYAEERARCASLASFLRGLGLRAGDRVSILAWNGQAFFESYFGAAALGAILNPLNVRQSAEELAAIVADAGSRFLIADAALADLAGALVRSSPPLEGVLWCGEGTRVDLGRPAFDFEAACASGATAFVPAAKRPDDVAQLYYTSGTTGRAKGVMLTQRNVATHALATIAELSLCERDRWAHVAPMFHLADAWAVFAITWAGGAHVMQARFEPRATLDLLERECVTLTNLVPTMLNLMVRDASARGRDWSALRLVLSGGAPIATEVVRAVIETFRAEYVQTYGMTETSPFLTMSILKEHLRALPPEEQLAWRAKTGRPFAAVELRVVDEAGRAVPADERTVGEIEVRGETVTPGYWNRPEETAASFRDGWLKTGDLAHVDHEGYVTIVDRKKDVILSGGEKVYTTAVENVLYAHPAVLEAAVFGLPDEIWGERVCAAVVPRAGRCVGAEELIEHCRAHLGGYELPREIVFLDALPRTGSGKISKRSLKARGYGVR